MRKYIVIWLVVAVLTNMLLSLATAPAKPAGWSEDINLTTNDDKYSGYPSIDIFKDIVHVVWMDERHYPVTNRAEVYYRNSTDGGRTWNPEIRHTFSDSTKTFSRIAVNGNNIHIVWVDDRDGGWKVYYINSTDGGNTWSNDRMISSFASSDNPAIAVNGSNIHVVYISNYKLYYINSTNNGITWSVPQQLTGSNRDSNHPAIAVNGNGIHIIWMDHYDRFGTGTMGAIFYINSSDVGLTWSEDFNLTPMNLDADYPDIVTNGNVIHVTFSEEVAGIWETHYRRSEDAGISWSDDIQLTDWGRDHYGSSIDVYNINVSIVWYTSWLKEPDGNGEIYYINSTDNGNSWSESLRLTYAAGFSGSADVSVSARMAHIVWADKRDSNVEIYYKHHPVPFPPTNLTIDIWGTNLILNWKPLQNSPSSIDHYLIYRVNDLDDFNFSNAWVNTSLNLDPIDGMIIPLRTSWNDTTAFLDENNNYFYIVRAIDAEGWNDTNWNIVGKFVIPLNQGWNLFSIPLAQRNTSVSKVLQTIDGNYNVIWVYDAKEDRWRSSTTDLTDINRTMGLWVHMKQACNLSVVGAVPESTDIALYESWNLVGYPSLKTRNINDALSGINWQAVQHYDAFDGNDPWKHNSTKKPDNLNDLKEMQSGRGYWVYVTINDTWVRTRTIEDNKIVIWNIGDSKEKIVNNQPIYELTNENPIEKEPENDYQVNIVPEQPIEEGKEESYAVSLIPLIILIAFVFAEIILLHKKR